MSVSSFVWSFARLQRWTTTAIVPLARKALGVYGLGFRVRVQGLGLQAEDIAFDTKALQGCIPAPEIQDGAQSVCMLCVPSDIT